MKGNIDNEEIKAAIVPHHLLAKELIEDLGERVIKNREIKKVFVIGPNHYETGKGDLLTDNKKLKALCNQLMQGETRTLVGYLVETESKLGRSNVIDLEIPTNQHRGRLVDHRSINWIILKNKKYILK